MAEENNAVDLKEIDDDELDKVSGGVWATVGRRCAIVCENPDCDCIWDMKYIPLGQTVTCPKCGFEMLITQENGPSVS